MKRTTLRRMIGYCAAVSAGMMMVYMALIIAKIAPMPMIKHLHQSPIHFLAQIIILLLLIAAVGFWEND